MTVSVSDESKQVGTSCENFQGVFKQSQMDSFIIKNRSPQSKKLEGKPYLAFRLV